MDIAMIGLGKMGANIARRLARDSHRVVDYNRTPEKAFALADAPLLRHRRHLLRHRRSRTWWR